MIIFRDVIAFYFDDISKYYFDYGIILWGLSIEISIKTHNGRERAVVFEGKEMKMTT